MPEGFVEDDCSLDIPHLQKIVEEILKLTKDSLHT